MSEGRFSSLDKNANARMESDWFPAKKKKTKKTTKNTERKPSSLEIKSGMSLKIRDQVVLLMSMVYDM